MPLAFFSVQEEVPTSWYYKSLTACELFVVPKEQLVTIIKKDGATAIYFIAQFSHEVHEIMTRLEGLNKTTTPEKLRIILRYLAACHTGLPVKGWYPVLFPVSHQLLADMMGVTRVSTVAAMKPYTEKGIVRYSAKTSLEINFKKLKAYRLHAVV